jgi:CHASE3 domain sensor protein
MREEPMRRFIIAFLLTALVTGAVVYTFATGRENHTQDVRTQDVRTQDVRTQVVGQQ